MAPKKGQAKADKRDVTASNGLFSESFAALSAWDDADNALENWGGDLNAALPSAIDPTALFVDSDFPTSGFHASFGSHLADWKRPNGLFSPFKPVVFRNPLAPSIANPYEFQGASGAAGTKLSPRGTTGSEEPDDENTLPQDRQAAIHQYRTMKPLVVPASIVSAAEKLVLSETATTAGGSSPIRRTRHRRGEQTEETPYFMRAYHSVLMMLHYVQDMVGMGEYAWELIHPQAPGTTNPLYNPWGKYAVKLFVGGAFRRVVVDDRLPVDRHGASLIAVTEHKEIWPALLAKAILKAMGPKMESILVQRPNALLSFLLPGWVPEGVSLCQEPISVMSLLRTFMAAHRADNLAIEIDAPPQSARGSNAPPQPQQHEKRGPVLSLTPSKVGAEKGLPAQQLFYVMDAKPYQTTTMLRLCSPHHAWSGQYSYDKPCWTAALEDALHFSPLKDRDTAKVHNCGWIDFWLTFEELVECFANVTLWRCVVGTKSWATYRTILHNPGQGAVGEPVVDKKGAAAAAAAPPQTPRDSSSGLCKWLYLKVDGNSPRQILLNQIGVPRLAPPEDTSEHPLPLVHIEVQRYQWKSSVPLTAVLRVAYEPGVPNSAVFLAAPGVNMFKVQAQHLPPGCGVSLMTAEGAVDVLVGEEKEICQQHGQIATVSDAGIFGAHNPGMTTLWFKRLLQVKAATTANFWLTTLPRGTDLAAHRTVGADASPAGGGKGKAPAPKGKGPQQAADSASVDQLDEVEHEIPITAYAKLTLLNLDNYERHEDTSLKILNATLQPNTKGYLLMGAATIPRTATETYGKGLWKLQASSDRVIDSFEARLFDEVTVRQSEYVHNDYSTLFKYNFTVAEAATGTIQLNLREQWGIPFHVTLSLNDKEIESRTNVRGSCLLEHVILAPSDKASVSTYSMHCVLDSKFTQEWEERRRVQVVQLFQQQCKLQQVSMSQKQAELRQTLVKDPSGAALDALNAAAMAGDVTPADQGAQSTSTQPLFSIPFQLTLHLSTSRIDIKEDNSIAEHLSQVKASWAKEGAANAAGAGGAPAKPPPKGKGPQQVVDESQLRQQKSRESRERFLKNLRGTFLPHVKDGKAVLDYTDEPGLRRAPLLAVAAHRLPAVDANAAAQSTEPSPIVVSSTGGNPAPAASPAPGAVPVAGPSSNSILAPHVLTAFKNTINEQVDRINNTVAHVKQHRKESHTEMLEATHEFWVKQRPDRVQSPLPGAEAAVEDDKNKKGNKKK